MAAAIAMHEAFTTLMTAGFTEEQALTLTAKMAREGRTPLGPEGP